MKLTKIQEIGEIKMKTLKKLLTLAALVTRFRRAGIKNPTLEAKKYILTNYKDK